MIDPDARFAFSMIQAAQDRWPLVREFSWRGLQNILTTYEERDDKNGPAFIPAEFEDPENSDERPRRCLEHVKKVSLAVVDFDGGRTIKEAMDMFREYEFILYTSHSHSLSKDKFRLVIPLERPVSGADWIMAWRHLETLAPGLDTQCKDASRLYFRPSCRPGGLRETHLNEGKLLRLDTSPRPPAASELTKQRATKVSLSQPHQVRRLNPDGTVTEYTRAGVGDWKPEWDMEIIKRLVPTYGSPLKIVGDNERYPCPINDHPDQADCSKYPFSIRANGVWHCFRCSPSGTTDDLGDGGAKGNGYGLAKMVLGVEGAKALLAEIQEAAGDTREPEDIKITWGKRNAS